MKKILILSVISLLLFNLSGIANATFIGDDVMVEHRVEGSTPFPWDWKNTTAAIGNEDRVEISAHTDNQATYGVDIESSSIWVDFLRETNFTAGQLFHGLYVSDLDWLGGDGFIISGASVTMNNAEWMTDRLDFGSDWVSLDWQGLRVFGDTFFEISLAVSKSVTDLPETNPAPTPEPATMLLLGAGLAGLAGARFRKKVGKEK